MEGCMSVDFREEGLLLYREGRYSTALETFLSMKSDAADDPELSYYIGLCHARLGEPEEAMVLLRKVLADDHNLIRLYQARMLLSWLLVETGQIEAAEQQLRGVLQEGFESPQTWSALGYCQWRRGHIDQALESYREALNLDKENPNAVNGLGYLLADSGEDPEQAVLLCRKAVESSPENAAYKDSLGWALFRAGRTTEAIRYLTDALTHRPGDKTIKDHLEAVRTHEKP
jgi:Flp pilus assembly protein TadD